MRSVGHLIPFSKLECCFFKKFQTKTTLVPKQIPRSKILATQVGMRMFISKIPFRPPSSCHHGSPKSIFTGVVMIGVFCIWNQRVSVVTWFIYCYGPNFSCLPWLPSRFLGPAKCTRLKSSMSVCRDAPVNLVFGPYIPEYQSPLWITKWCL